MISIFEEIEFDQTNFHVHVLQKLQERFVQNVL